MIDFGVLEKLIDLLNRSDAHTIEVRKGFWSTTVRISKGGGGLSNSGGPVTYQVAAGNPTPAPAAPAAPEQVAKSLTEIKSPMVGTFYTQPEPGADPYVRAGSRIKPGDTLCIIEAMKIMNPLDSEVSGVVREVLADDAQPVEFGQVLFRVDPNA